MGKLFKHRRKKIGLSPGVLVYTGKKTTKPVKITVIDYDETEYSVKEFDNVTDVFEFKDKPTKTWINIEGLYNIEIIEKLCNFYGIHPLVQEDILSIDQRPKFLDMESYIYVVLKLVYLDEITKKLDSEQLSIIIGDNFVITFLEQPTNIFDNIKERIKKERSRHRRFKSDYLAYTLIDAVIDSFYNLLEGFGDKVEMLDEKLLDKSKTDSLKEVHRLKREVIYLRNLIWPLRDVVKSLEKNESHLLLDGTDPYWRDVYDHIVQILDVLGSYREVIMGMLDIHLTIVNNKMNEVMKVLTIIATIFIPLSFLTSLYGMNFEYIPELTIKYGYFVLWGIIIIIISGMLIFFRKRKWL